MKLYAGNIMFQVYSNNVMKILKNRRNYQDKTINIMIINQLVLLQVMPNGQIDHTDIDIKQTQELEY